VREEVEEGRHLVTVDEAPLVDEDAVLVHDAAGLKGGGEAELAVEMPINNVFTLLADALRLLLVRRFHLARRVRRVEALEPCVAQASALERDAHLRGGELDVACPAVRPVGQAAALQDVRGLVAHFVLRGRIVIPCAQDAPLDHPLHLDVREDRPVLAHCLVKVGLLDGVLELFEIDALHLEESGLLAEASGDETDSCCHLLAVQLLGDGLCPQCSLRVRALCGTAVGHTPGHGLPRVGRSLERGQARRFGQRRRIKPARYPNAGVNLGEGISKLRKIEANTVSLICSVSG
jgi:hypothetical protein